MLQVVNLRKRFGKVLAVDDVSFDAEDGRITALLGPNGAGKSTTLRMIAGVVRPDAGAARIDGRDVATDTQAAVSSLGTLPYNSGLYPRLTGRENIAYFGRLHGLKNAELDRRVDELVHDLGLADVADRQAKGYSQGESMKVAVARALVHRPRNIILDEPTNGLDVKALRALREMIRDLKSRGHCILFSSHVMQEVAALCDRIVIVSHGRVTAAGTPEELRAKYAQPDLEEIFIQAVED
ncbi:MAG TPA: ATP-binding cassette domain-containing protein [Gammaproteobacteria bacterium]